MQFSNSHRNMAIFGVVLTVLAALVVIPSLAQTPSDPTTVVYPATPNTITVTGYGTAQGTPDLATVDVGVESFNTSVSEAFSLANTTQEAVVNALVELGIAREDITTRNLNVYNTPRFNPETSSDEWGYVVSNTVSVIVRDIAQIETVIDTAIGAGANTLYGLNFTIDDPTTLEATARESAMSDARVRAEQYAALIGVQLGDVITISETINSGVIPYALDARNQSGGGGGAFVTPGQSEVNIQTTVTYSFTR